MCLVLSNSHYCTPTAFKFCVGIVFTHGVRMSGWVDDGKKACQGYISETLRCMILIFGHWLGVGVQHSSGTLI